MEICPCGSEKAYDDCCQPLINGDRSADTAEIRISDNGIGLPEDTSRLFEPYVTTRDKGTGLGLPIVKKIIEEHGGTLTLEPAIAFDDTDRRGAMAVIRLPSPVLPMQQARVSSLISGNRVPTI